MSDLRLTSETNENEIKIRIAGIIRESIVDGPGIRFVVFSQGCPHGCLSCHNPETHDFSKGYEVSKTKILKEIDKNPLLSGVTFSGGEPMIQSRAFAALAKDIKERKLDILIFSGYTFEELISMNKQTPSIMELLEMADYLIDGKYIHEERDLTQAFKGSKNQRFIDLKKSLEEGKVIVC